MPKIPLKKISPLIPYQASLPLFVKENYPTFIAFLQAYYEFLEQSGNVVDGIFNVRDDRDIDCTVDDFIKYFYFQLMPNIPTNILADPRRLAKHIKEFYLARGTEKSYRLLFRILYNEEIDFYYPKVDLFKPSDGKWTVNTIIRTTTFHNTFSFIGLVLTGVTSGATAAVENVVQFQIGSNLVSEITISNIVGNFVLGENISCNSIQEGIFSLVSGVQLTNPGLKYQPNDLILIDDFTGVSALAEVINVTGTQKGRVVDATNTFILNPGPSQTVLPPTITLTPLASSVDDYYEGMPVTIIDGIGAGEEKTIISYDGTTNIAVVDSDWQVIPTFQSHYQISLGQIETIQMKNFGINYSIDATADFSQTGDGTATGFPLVTPTATYPGQWLTRDSFISDIKKLQDSHYWQDFSYVLKTQQSINQYSAIVKTLLHPAGTAMFGEVQLNTLLTLGPDFRTFERHKFRFTPYEGFDPSYPDPNLGYWPTDPLATGYANTPIQADSNIICGQVDEFPFTRRNQVADCWINIFDTVDTIPANEVVEYNCVEGSDHFTLYDVHSGTPLYNGILGSTDAANPNAPAYVGGGNLLFSAINQYCNCSTVPINPLRQTVMIVANPSTLDNVASLIGCIDADNPGEITGYQIQINPNGSVTFITQKFNGVINNLSVTSPPGSVSVGNWFVATLGYGGNTIYGTINNLHSLTATYPTNIDGSGILNNSDGWFIGNQGFVPPYTSNAFWGNSVWKHTLWNSRASIVQHGVVTDTFFNLSTFNHYYWNGGPGASTTTIPVTGIGNSFLGEIAYAIIWNGLLSGSDTLQAYNYVKNIVSTRGILLP